jgi:hypothetical protein
MYFLGSPLSEREIQLPISLRALSQAIGLAEPVQMMGNAKAALGEDVASGSPNQRPGTYFDMAALCRRLFKLAPAPPNPVCNHQHAPSDMVVPSS